MNGNSLQGLILVLLVHVIGCQQQRRSVALSHYNHKLIKLLACTYKVLPADISEITFCTPLRKKRSNNATICSGSGSVKWTRVSSVKPTSERELEEFIKSVADTKVNPAILKITLPYAEKFIPRLSDANFPTPISELYNPDMLNVGYLELISECERLFTDMKVFF